MTDFHEDLTGPVEPDPEQAAAEQAAASPGGATDAVAAAEAIVEAAGAAETDWEALAAERTGDLQRLQAEYVNYKKRVDRDRALSRQAGVEAVVADLMPVLDSIELARLHGDLEGGFKLVADELEKLATKYGLVAFGEVGEEFDPARHDALMQVPLDEPVTVVTISQVMQRGYQLGDRVVRPARVGVANP